MWFERDFKLVAIPGKAQKDLSEQKNSANINFCTWFPIIVFFISFWKNRKKCYSKTAESDWFLFLALKLKWDSWVSVKIGFFSSFLCT